MHHSVALMLHGSRGVLEGNLGMVDAIASGVEWQVETQFLVA